MESTSSLRSSNFDSMTYNMRLSFDGLGLDSSKSESAVASKSRFLVLPLRLNLVMANNLRRGDFQNFSPA